MIYHEILMYFTDDIHWVAFYVLLLQTMLFLGGLKEVENWNQLLVQGYGPLLRWCQTKRQAERREQSLHSLSLTLVFPSAPICKTYQKTMWAIKYYQYPSPTITKMILER